MRGGGGEAGGGEGGGEALQKELLKPVFAIITVKCSWGKLLIIKLCAHILKIL